MADEKKEAVSVEAENVKRDMPCQECDKCDKRDECRKPCKAVRVESEQPQTILAKPVEKPVEKSSAPADFLAMIPMYGTIKTSHEQQAILFGPTDENDVEIRPDGLVYLPWMGYVERLRNAFGTEWSLMPQGKPIQRDGVVLWAFYLVITGKVAGYAIGECAQTVTMTYGDCLEGAKSNALMRLCKGIGISLELWKPSFIRAWKAKYAEEYFDESKKKNLWRRRGEPAPELTAMPIVTPAPPSSVAQPTPVGIGTPTPTIVTKAVIGDNQVQPAQFPSVSDAKIGDTQVTPAFPPTPPIPPASGEQQVPGTKVTTVTVNVSAVKIHKPGPRSNAKNPSYRIVDVNTRMYYTFDKTLAVIAHEAMKSGRSVTITYETTAYGFKISTLKSGAQDVPLPSGG